MSAAYVSCADDRKKWVVKIGKEPAAPVFEKKNCNQIFRLEWEAEAGVGAAWIETKAMLTRTLDMLPEDANIRLETHLVPRDRRGQVAWLNLCNINPPEPVSKLEGERSILRMMLAG